MEWIKVENSLPEPGITCLVFGTVGNNIAFRPKDSVQFYEKNTAKRLTVTHWMPLPASPKD